MKRFAGYNTRHNVLTGYDFYLNFTSNYSESTPAVGLEASSLWAGVGFYSKERDDSGTTNTQDDREPLGTAYAFNYLNAGGVTTAVTVWKNYHEFDYDNENVLACLPYIYYAWDENEAGEGPYRHHLPLGSVLRQPRAERVPVRDPAGPGHDHQLHRPDERQRLDADRVRPLDPDDRRNWQSTFLQAYVFAKYNFGAYSTSVEATTMANFWCFGSQQNLPFLNTYNGTGFWYVGPATP